MEKKWMGDDFLRVPQPEPIEVPQEDKEFTLQKLRELGGCAPFNILLEVVEKEKKWEDGYALVVITELHDEGKISLGKVKTGKPGPQLIQICLKTPEGGEEE